MTKATDNKNIVKATLQDSKMEVVADLSKANGRTLMKAREASGGMATVIYIMAEIATFNGEQIPAPELLDKLSAYDIIDLESIWASGKK